MHTGCINYTQNLHNWDVQYKLIGKRQRLRTADRNIGGYNGNQTVPTLATLLGWRPQGLPYGGLIHQVFPLPIILHVRLIGGKHGVKGENLLLDGSTVRYLPKGGEGREGQQKGTLRGTSVAYRALPLHGKTEGAGPLLPLTVCSFLGSSLGFKKSTEPDVGTP